MRSYPQSNNAQPQPPSPHLAEAGRYSSLVLTGTFGKDPDSRQTQTSGVTTPRYHTIAEVCERFASPTSMRDGFVLPLYTRGVRTERHRLVVLSRDLHRIRLPRRGDRVEVQGRPEIVRYQARDGSIRELSFSAISRYEAGNRPLPPELRRHLVLAMGFPPYAFERTASFVRWARAARLSALAAGRPPASVRIDLLEAEAGLWLEDLVRGVLTDVLADPSLPAPSPAAQPSPRGWRERVEAPSPPEAAADAPAGVAAGGPPVGRPLRILRVIRRWSRTKLAAAARCPPDALRAYEQDRTRPQMATLLRLLAAMDYPPDILDRTFAFVRSAQAARASHLGRNEDPLRAQVEDFAVHEAWLAEDYARAGLIRLTTAARLMDERRRAPALWERLKACPEEGRRDLVREAPDFQTSGLCELLCQESVTAAHESADRAFQLAELAVWVAERAAGENRWRSRLLGYARAHRANAWRVRGDLLAAEAESAAADTLWSVGAASDPGLLNEARMLQLKASLRRAQRHPNEAIVLLDEALAIDRWGETTSLLLGKAMVLEARGDFEQSIALLGQVGAQIDGDRQPRLSYTVRHNMALNLCHLGRHAEADLMFPAVRSQAVRVGDKLELVRVLWVQGLIAAGLGRTKEAIDILERVRSDFIRRKIVFDTALVTLELGEIHASLGHPVEVKVLARESAAVFQDQGVHPEAQRALELFRRAAEEDTASPHLVRSVVAYLYRARHDPQLPFSEAA